MKSHSFHFSSRKQEKERGGGPSFFLIFLHVFCRSPDTSKVRSKMVYASSKDRFKRELDGIQVELQATDPSEMSFDIIKARAL